MSKESWRRRRYAIALRIFSISALSAALLPFAALGNRLRNLEASTSHFAKGTDHDGRPGQE